MAKTSRPIVYAVVAAAAVYAIVVLTEPEAPPKKAVSRTGRSSGPTAPVGFTPEDLTARFDRYVPAPNSNARDAFKPVIIPSRTHQEKTAAGLGGLGPGGLSAMLPPLSGRGSWSLTGISEIDGVRNALIENPTTGDSEFLKAGTTWNGLKVAAVDDVSVVFENALGQRTRLTFAAPPEEGGARNAAPVATVVPRGAPGAAAPTGVTVPPGGVAPVTPAFPTRVGSAAAPTPLQIRGRQ